jgi:hypothetical protein
VDTFFVPNLPPKTLIQLKLPLLMSLCFRLSELEPQYMDYLPAEDKAVLFDKKLNLCILHDQNQVVYSAINLLYKKFLKIVDYPYDCDKKNLVEELM